MSTETTKKHSKIDNFKGKQTSKGFTSKRQPKPEVKSNGWLRKKKGQELAKAILELTFQGAHGSQLRKQMADYYNVPETEITIEMMGLFRQAEKMIGKADTPAFKAIMERAHGAPKQEIEASGELTMLAPVINVKPSRRD